MSERFWTPAAPAVVPSRALEAEVRAAALGFEGHFTVELVHAPSGLVRRRLEFRNVITDAALNYIGTAPIHETINFLAVGTGSTPPATTNVSLEAQLGGRTSSNGGYADSYGTNSSAAPPYQYCRRTRVFVEAEANGNLTELGFFSAATGGTMFNRQLFRDAGGVPTTITKTNTDQLRVTFEWRLIAPADDVTGEITLSGPGTVHQFTSRAQRNLVGGTWAKGSPGGWSAVEQLGYWGINNRMTANNATALAATTGYQSKANYINSASAALAAYTSGSLFRESTYTFEPNQGTINVSGAEFGYAGNADSFFQSLITPAIPKTDTRRLVLGMRMSWGRA